MNSTQMAVLHVLEDSPNGATQRQIVEKADSAALHLTRSQVKRAITALKKDKFVVIDRQTRFEAAHYALAPAPYPWCRDLIGCLIKGYCLKDPSCGD